MFQELRDSRDFVEVRPDFAGFAGFRRSLVGFRRAEGDLEEEFAGLRATRRDLAEVSEDSGGILGCSERRSRISQNSGK